MSRNAEEHKFLTPLQEKWALPFELRPSGKMLKQAEKIHQQLRGTEPCKFCLSWTNADVFNLPDPGHDVRQEPLSAKIEGVHYTLLHKDEQLLSTIISRWQSWQHGFGAVQLDYNDSNQKMAVVHAKYCKAICPNGHYALPNGQQMHGKYEGNKADLMADMRALRTRLMAVPSLEAVMHALFVPPAELPLPVPPARPVRRAVPPVEAFYDQVKDQPVDVSKPVMPKAMWKPPALIPEPLSCVRYLTMPEALTPAHPGVFPPHPVFDLSAMPAHVPCEHTSSRPSAQVMALMLPGAGAALDKEQAQLDNVVVAHGFRPPLPPAPPSFVPMVTPPAPIGYVEGHRPLFLLDTSSKTMARKGRMQLMRDVLTALVQPCGEVRRYTQRFEVMLGGLEEHAQHVPAWCKYTNTTAAACEAVEAGLASEDLEHHAGGRSLYDALKLAIRKTRPNNYWREQQHALSDGIYLLSDGGGVAKGPLERMVATMCLTPQAVAIHCVALRPDARGRELLQYISGMTGGTYVECHAVDAPPPPPATPYSLLRAIDSEDEMRALLNLIKQGEHTAYAPQGDGEVFSVLSPDWLGEERGRPAARLEALLPTAPSELFEQQKQLQQFYAEWEDEDETASEAEGAGRPGDKAMQAGAAGAEETKSIMAELEAMQRSNCPRHQAALLSEAMGWVAAAVASRREANLHRHEESFERVDEMLRDPSFKRQYTQTFVGRYTRWVETVVAVAYADHSGSTDQALGGQDFRKQWDSVSDMLAGVEGAPASAKSLALAAAKEAAEQADEHGLPRWARAAVMPDAPPDPNQERSDTLFACHNVTRQWLKLKTHYDLEAMRINQHHRGAVKAAMDAAMHGYLDSSLPAAPLQTPPDESSLPEPTLEQAAAAAKLQTAMEAVREKFTTQLCSLDLQLLELARAQGLPTDEQEAAKDSGAPALMKARNDQWAELLEVRLDRVAAIQSAYCEELAALMAADKVQFNAKAVEVRERNEILRERHSELLEEAAEGCRAVVAEAEATYSAIWEAHDRAAAAAEERGRAGGRVSAESSDASLAFTELATPLSKVDAGLGGRRSVSRISGRRSVCSGRGGSGGSVRPASARPRSRDDDAETLPPTPVSHAALCRASPLVGQQHAASLTVSPAVRRRVGWAPTGGGHSSPEVIGRRQPSLYITNLIDTSPPSITAAAGADKGRDVISPDNPFDLEEEAPRTPFTNSVASATPRSLLTTSHTSVVRAGSRQHSNTPVPPSPASTSASTAPRSTIRSRTSPRPASARSLRASAAQMGADRPSPRDAGGPTQQPSRRSLSRSRASSANGSPTAGSPRRSVPGSSPRRSSPPPPPPPVIEAAVVLRTVPPPPVSEASQALYGERALAWRTDLHRVADGFPELLEACWQYGVDLVAWRNQFNTHARDVGAQRLQNEALVEAEREYVEACAAWEAAVEAKTAGVRAKSGRLIEHWRTAFLARLRALTPQVQAAEACAEAEGFRWAEAQGRPHVMRRSCHEDGAAVYDGMPLRYEIAMLGQAAARKRQADTELAHVHELILLMDNYGAEPPVGDSAADRPTEQRMTLTEKIVDVVTWVYRSKNPFNGVQGHHNGFFDPRRAPCRLPRTPSPAPAPPPSSRAASPMPPALSSPSPLPRRVPSPLGRKLKPKPAFLLND